MVVLSVVERQVYREVILEDVFVWEVVEYLRCQKSAVGEI